jgi:hypothetical protein
MAPGSRPQPRGPQLRVTSEKVKSGATFNTRTTWSLSRTVRRPRTPPGSAPRPHPSLLLHRYPTPYRGRHVLRESVGVVHRSRRQIAPSQTLRFATFPPSLYKSTAELMYPRSLLELKFLDIPRLGNLTLTLDFMCPYSNRPLKPLPLDRLMAGFVNWCIALDSAVDLFGRCACLPPRRHRTQLLGRRVRRGWWRWRRAAASRSSRTLPREWVRCWSPSGATRTPSSSPCRTWERCAPPPSRARLSLRGSARLAAHAAGSRTPAQSLERL